MYGLVLGSFIWLVIVIIHPKIILIGEFHCVTTAAVVCSSGRTCCFWCGFRLFSDVGKTRAKRPFPWGGLVMDCQLFDLYVFLSCIGAKGSYRVIYVNSNVEHNRNNTNSLCSFGMRSCATCALFGRQIILHIASKRPDETRSCEEKMWRWAAGWVSKSVSERIQSSTSPFGKFTVESKDMALMPF